MIIECDFEIAARVVDLDGSTLIVSLDDPANGKVLLNPIGWPAHTSQRPRTRWGRAWGDVPHGVPTRGPGSLVLNGRTEGTWGQAMARQEAIQTALFGSVFDYFVELDMEGTRYRWITDWPNFEPRDIRSTLEISNGWWPYQVTFPVQPRPLVTAIP